MEKIMEKQTEKQVLTFEGVVREVCDVETRPSKLEEGLYYEVRKIKVESEEKYPQSAYFTVRSQKLLNFPFHLGTRVKVFYNLKSYTTAYGVGTSINAWDMIAID